MKDIVLPFGFHGEIPPDEDTRCNLLCCKVKIMNGPLCKVVGTISQTLSELVV
jgi:hypothetical protein